MIFDTELKDINIDTKRFQNRNTSYSERSVQIICDNYDERLMTTNPVTLWKDKNGTIWLLAGHSRYKAHSILQKPTIKSVFFEGPEADAIEFARNSNNIGSRENYLERLKLYREKYKLLGYEGIQDYILKYEDKRSLPYLLELLHLNSDGRLIELLSSTIDAGDQTMRNTLESIASMIGRARIDYSDKLTNSHELEMFVWLSSDANFKSTNKGKFLKRIGSITAKERFDKNTPLLLSGQVYKPEAIKRYEKEEQELKDKLQSSESAISDIHQTLNKPCSTIERQRLILKRNGMLAEADALRLSLSKHTASKFRYEEAAENEYDMFNPPPDKLIPKQTTLKDIVRKEKNDPLKSIDRKEYTLNGVSTTDTEEMVSIGSLVVGDKYKRRNKPTYKEWTVLEVEGDILKVTSGQNNFHSVKAEKSLLVYKVLPNPQNT